MTKFSDLGICDTFDFIGPNRLHNSFYDRCIKISARKYRALDTFLNTMEVGNTSVEVFHVKHVIS